MKPKVYSALKIKINILSKINFKKIIILMILVIIIFKITLIKPNIKKMIYNKDFSHLINLIILTIV